MIAVGGGVWWTLAPRHPPPLGRDWTASVVTIAGDGVSGVRDGDADHARLSDPFGIVVRPDGTIVFADGGESPRIRGIGPDGRVFTVAGGARGFADGTGADARFDMPSVVPGVPSPASVWTWPSGSMTRIRSL